MKNQNKKSDNGKTGKTTPEESPVLVTGKSGSKTMSKKERSLMYRKYQDSLESMMESYTRYCLGHTTHTIPSIKKNFEMSIDNVLGWLASDNQQPLVSEVEI